MGIQFLLPMSHSLKQNLFLRKMNLCCV
ncbi:hypothetical protein CKAN_02632900 [Cinnamomum micranthum f. kanehirae]|uniref:Uncharacterized protein n=1 Tax=Cinnamomum micranthum f. kanehirae TaxID=337451 RepID=A0A3S3PSP0_9MAGN|nr:hypothetical protein CKAN_02632900 [Cinnamomum micranthum f. kanehirae]